MKTSSPRPELKMLERADCERIHQASCEILEKIGVVFHHDEALALLLNAGATVSDNLVKIPPALVEQALQSVPDRFTLYRRGTDQPALLLDGEAVYFGSGSDTLHYLDPRTGERRDFTVQDLADCVRVCDGLP